MYRLIMNCSIFECKCEWMTLTLTYHLLVFASASLQPSKHKGLKLMDGGNPLHVFCFFPWCPQSDISMATGWAFFLCSLLHIYLFSGFKRVTNVTCCMHHCHWRWEKRYSKPLSQVLSAAVQVCTRASVRINIKIILWGIFGFLCVCE